MFPWLKKNSRQAERDVWFSCLPEVNAKIENIRPVMSCLQYKGEQFTVMWEVSFFIYPEDSLVNLKRVALLAKIKALVTFCHPFLEQDL